MMQYILDGFKAFFDWVISYVAVVINPILQPVADKIPDCSMNITAIVSFLGFLNSWFPLDYGVGLIAVYYTILLIFIVGRSVLKFVPFIG
jgi:hypothetical protein